MSDRDGLVHVSAGPVGDLPPGEAVVVEVRGREVAVFNVGGRLHALDNRCLHRGGPLARGFVRDGVVTCPWHWWRYDLSTGCKLGEPARRLRAYEVTVRDGEVIVAVPRGAGHRDESLRDLLLRHARGGPDEGDR